MHVLYFTYRTNTALVRTYQYYVLSQVPTCTRYLLVKTIMCYLYKSPGTVLVLCALQPIHTCKLYLFKYEVPSTFTFCTVQVQDCTCTYLVLYHLPYM